MINASTQTSNKHDGFEGYYFAKHVHTQLLNTPILNTLGYLFRYVNLLVLLDILPLSEVKYNEKVAWDEAVDKISSTKIERAQYLTRLSVSIDLFADRLNNDAYLALNSFNEVCTLEDRIKLPGIMDLYVKKVHPYYRMLEINIDLINQNLITRNDHN